MGPQPRKETTSYTTTFFILLFAFFLSLKIDFLSYVSKSFERDHKSQGTDLDDRHPPKEITSIKSVETGHQHLDVRRDDYVEHGCIAAARAERKKKEENGSNYANDYLDIASLEASDGQNTEAAWMSRLKKVEEEEKKK